MATVIPAPKGGFAQGAGLGQNLISLALRIKANERAEAEHLARMKKLGDTNLKAMQDVKQSQQAIEKSQEDARLRQLNEQRTALTNVIGDGRAGIKSLQATLKSIREAEVEDPQEVAQAHAARNMLTKRVIQAQVQLNNLNQQRAGLPQMTGEQMAAQINSLYDGITTQQHQRDAVTAEELSKAKIATQLLTDPKLFLRGRLRKEFGKKGGRAVENTLIFDALETVLGKSSAAAKTALALRMGVLEAEPEMEQPPSEDKQPSKPQETQVPTVSRSTIPSLLDGRFPRNVSVNLPRTEQIPADEIRELMERAGVDRATAQRILLQTLKNQ